jgi:hypothetical protein
MVWDLGGFLGKSDYISLQKNPAGNFFNAPGYLIPEEDKESPLSGRHVSRAVKTLTEIMKENARGKNIDFLFLDIEGMELPVL